LSQNSMEYYNELKLTKSAAHDDVTAGFRRLALQWHPDRNPDDPAQAKKKFDKICEAYDVLSNPLYRAIYDQYGAKGLKDGVADGRGGTVKGTGKYKFGANGTSDEIFTRVFGTANPFAELFQISNEFFDPGFVPPSTAAVVTKLECTLEELFAGGIKIVPVDLPGYGPKQVPLEIKRGWRDGTRLSMSAKDVLKGEACPKSLQAVEFVFLVSEAKHPLYTRNGDDLVHEAKIPLVRAMTGCTLALATLDGREITVGVNDVIAPGYEKVVSLEGMPSFEEDGKFGDLVIKFKVEFPVALNEAQRHLVKTALFLPEKCSEDQAAALQSVKRTFFFD